MNIPGHIDVNTYLKNRFGHKVYKLALSSGCSCPNRDGLLGSRGCIFCSRGGSGDFAAPADMSVKEQIDFGKKLLANKLKATDINELSYIAYFQSFTNTYAPVEKLKALFTEAITQEEISILSIATRPDCLSDECIEMLSKLNKIKPVWVELGLQTIHEETAEYIKRGYRLEVFEDAVSRLHKAGIEIIVHIILGLPGESEEMMLDTVKYIAANKKISGIKLQLLHVLEDSELGDLYSEQLAKVKSIPLIEQKERQIPMIAAKMLGLQITNIDQYISIIKKCLQILPKDIIIHRLTGDAPRKSLLYPLFSSDKKRILNAIKTD
ncbi:MAG: TIGR01212 family radical SAM protein [Lachnospiraceae bacterium]|nr:TIGR01212 family radical SAM protein [Lachnospiraceae bacterium]